MAEKTTEFDPQVILILVARLEGIGQNPSVKLGSQTDRYYGALRQIREQIEAFQNSVPGYPKEEM